MTDNTASIAKPGDVARYIACQAALVRALNTAISTLEMSGNGFSAQNARQARDEALAIGPGDPND